MESDLVLGDRKYGVKVGWMKTLFAKRVKIFLVIVLGMLCLTGLLVGCDNKSTPRFDGKIEDYFGRGTLVLPFAWEAYRYDNEFLSTLSLEEQSVALVAAGYEVTMTDNYEGRMLCIARVTEGAKEYFGIVEQNNDSVGVYYKTSNFSEFFLQERVEQGVIVIFTPFLPAHLVSELVGVISEGEENKTVVESDFAGVKYFYESVKQQEVVVDDDEQTITLMMAPTHFVVLLDSKETFKNKPLQVAVHYKPLEERRGLLEMGVSFL